MAIKPIKIVTGVDCWDTKIYEGDEDITEKIGGIFGIDIKLRVDELPKMTIHRHNSKMEYVSGASHDLTIINYEQGKKISESIIDDTNYSNAKNGRHFKKI